MKLTLNEVHHIQKVSDHSLYWTKQGKWGDLCDAKTFASMWRAYNYAETHIPKGEFWRIIEEVKA